MRRNAPTGRHHLAPRRNAPVARFVVLPRRAPRAGTGRDAVSTPLRRARRPRRTAPRRLTDEGLALLRRLPGRAGERLTHGLAGPVRTRLDEEPESRIRRSAPYSGRILPVRLNACTTVWGMVEHRRRTKVRQDDYDSSRPRDHDPQRRRKCLRAPPAPAPALALARGPRHGPVFSEATLPGVLARVGVRRTRAPSTRRTT